MSSPFSHRELLKTFADTQLPTLARTMLSHRAMPGYKESCVIALESPMAAALCFDRVWSIPIDGTDCPEDIAFNCTSDAELVAALWLHFWKNNEQDLRDYKNADVEALAQAIVKGDNSAISERQDLMRLYSMTLLSSTLAGGLGELDELQKYLNGTTRTLYTDIQKLGIKVVPLYANQASLDAEYTAGDHSVIITALKELNLVDEKDLTWEQVQEFRQDRSSRADYQRLVHWLDGEMVGRPLQFVVDDLGLRLEKYRTALKKHGLKSRLGALTSILDPKGLASMGAIVGGALLAEQAIAATIAAGSVLVGKVLLSVGQSKLDLHDIHSEHAEIAFVAEVAETFSKK